jgi:DMSO/TMAO reductase YedYZ molybdopterin-dependent catalytic subunit
MRLPNRYAITLIFIALCYAIAFGQSKPLAVPRVDFPLKVNGEVARPLNLTADDWKKLPRRSVRAKDHDGKESEYEGVELGEILKLVGVKSGEALRGNDLALFLVVEAADHYRAVFALPELDHAFTDRVVLLADRRDGKPLAPNEGLLHLVVPDEKRPARWVRQVVVLTIRRAE